jgi:rhodanese-related sulfurtransferase
MSFLKKFFGPGPDFKAMRTGGAIILDVRSPSEFSTGHISGAKNIPLQQLQAAVKSIPKDVPIITCCASGIRSASAKTTLKRIGFTHVENGGSWLYLKSKL